MDILKIIMNFMKLFFPFFESDHSQVVRQTVNGPVEGIHETSILGQQYYAFRGVPYAEPPISGIDPYTGEKVDRRFKAPQPLKRTWSEHLEVHNFADFCTPSIDVYNISRTSENCLFLNIYVPAGGAKRKTVLVWIHGGGFNFDNSGIMYGPDFLLFQNNILVTVEYRLGIFGFLNLGFGEYTGNMGLKDQQLSLKLIHENIEQFSGNKNEILFFGQSAGSAQVSLHMLNEESRKYFKRAILFSSSAFTPYTIYETNNLEQMKDFSKISDEKELIQYLKTESGDILAKSFLPDTEKLANQYPWTPAIESSTTPNAFMTQWPEEIYNSDKAPNMDVLFGFVSKESLYFMPELIGNPKPLIPEHVEDTKIPLPFDGFNMTSYPKEYKQALDKLRESYFSDLSNVKAMEHANFGLGSDGLIVYSTLKAAAYQTRVNNDGADGRNHKNTFILRFSANAGLNIFQFGSRIQYDGATHADEYCYFFRCRFIEALYEHHLQQKDAAYDLIMRMVKMITNFARTGNPSVEKDTPFVSCTSPHQLFCQEISNEPKSSVIANVKEQTHYDVWH